MLLCEGCKNTKSLRQYIVLGLLPSAELAAPFVTQVLSARQERVIDEHLGRPAPFHIFIEALVDEVLEVGRPLRLNFRWLILNNVEEDSSVVLGDVRWLAHGELDREDAERPDVDLVVVLAAALD